MAAKKAAKNRAKRATGPQTLIAYGVVQEYQVLSIFLKKPTAQRDPYVVDAVEMTENSETELCGAAIDELGLKSVPVNTLVELQVTPKILGRWVLPDVSDEVPFVAAK